MSGLRIVSLLPSATEIVAAVGMAGQLVGRSHQCDFPPDVARLPALSATKVRLDGTSLDIDRRVNEIIAQGVSVYSVDAERLRALRPDVIVTQTQCAICAVTPADLEEALCEWTGMAPTLVSLEPNDLSDVWADMRRVGRALGVEDAAHAAIVGLQARLDRLRRIAALTERRPTVAAIEWIDPLMAGGNWMPELIQMAGGINLFGEAGKHSPWMTWDELESADPDIILVTPCGFDIDRTLQEMHLLASQPGWTNLKAVKAGRVIVADGNQYFNRPGPRLLESLEILAEVFHPDTFNFGHQDRGWVRYGVTEPAKAR